METESPDHRERRLQQLSEAIEKHLEEGWLYFLVIGKPGEVDSINLVSNSTMADHQQIIDILQTITERSSKGVQPQEL